MTPGSREARDVETLISNHIRDKGTPEEKEALKRLRDDFLKSIGGVYRGGVSSAHAGQTRYEKSRQRRAYFRDAMNEEDAMSAVADYDASKKPHGDGVIFDLDAMRDATARFVELLKDLDADELQTLRDVLTPEHPLYDEVALANISLARKARGE
jgi:hypothetical protein